MEASFPASQDLKRGEDTALRWAVRSISEKQGTSGFIFINNYERFCQLSAKKNVQLSACGVTLPRLTIPSGCMAIFPVNIDGIRYATAQLVARRDGKTYMMQIPGIPTTIAMTNGKTLKNVKPRGTDKPVYGNLYLLTQPEAEQLFLTPPSSISHQTSSISHHPSAILTWTKVKDAGALRTIVKGKAKVAAAPSEQDWQQAAVYSISLPGDSTWRTPHAMLLTINYRGDCARLYANGRLIADNFYYGRPFLYGLWRLPDDCTELELRILPLQPDAPIYLPREANKTSGEQVNSIEIKDCR